MLDLKIRKFGNSLGTILPKELLAQLNADEGDVIHATRAPDGSIRLTLHDPMFKAHMEIAREGMKKYRNTLRELAK